jgi:hypothetical protein
MTATKPEDIRILDDLLPAEGFDPLPPENGYTHDALDAEIVSHTGSCPKLDTNFSPSVQDYYRQACFITLAIGSAIIGLVVAAVTVLQFYYPPVA